MNKVVLMGRLTKDPDIKYSQGNKSTCIARYILAVTRKVKSQDGKDADFINCIAFGKNGEFAEKYLKRGIKLVISGRIQTGNYEKNGAKVYTTEVVVEEQEFAESKSANESMAANPQQKQEPQQMSFQTESNQPTKNTQVNDQPWMQIPDGYEDNLPFV